MKRFYSAFVTQKEKKMNSNSFPYPAANHLEIDLDLAYDKANYHQTSIQRLHDRWRWGWCFWWANIFFAKRT
jgi:hypothetical protein